MARTATVLEVASSSSPGTTYKVWVDATGPIFCNCPGHRFVRADGKRRTCKHMKAVAESVVCGQAMSLAEAGVVPKGTELKMGRSIRIIELQEEKTEGTWVTVTDLSRFANLEVM
jgi:hypothetical protein